MSGFKKNINGDNTNPLNWELIFIYISLFLFIFGDMHNIGKDLGKDDLAKKIVGPLKSADLALLSMIPWIILKNRLITKILFKPYTLIYIIIITVLAIFGFIINGINVYWNDDVRIWFMIALGFMWMIALRGSRFPIIHVLVVTCIFCSVMFMSSYMDPKNGTHYEGMAIRVSNSIMFNYVPLVLIFQGFCTLIWFGRRNWSGLIGFLISSFALVVGGAIIGATRSILISYMLVVLLSMLSGMRMNSAKRISYKPLVESILFFTTILIPFILMPRLRESINLLIFRITEDSSSIDNINLRTEEIPNLFHSLSLVEWITGRGFGGQFNSVIYGGGLTPEAHIGIFTFLLKGGVLLFSSIFLLIAIYLPLKYLNEIFSRKLDSKNEIIFCYPSIIGITSLLFMSGGYTIYSFLAWGLCFGILLNPQKNKFYLL